MSKILGSWSGMRKYLEQEMLAKLESELDKQPKWLRQIYLLRFGAQLN